MLVADIVEKVYAAVLATVLNEAVAHISCGLNERMRWRIASLMFLVIVASIPSLLPKRSLIRERIVESASAIICRPLHHLPRHPRRLFLGSCRKGFPAGLCRRARPLLGEGRWKLNPPGAL